METVKVYRLKNLPAQMFQRLKAAQMQSAMVWNLCRDIHLEARLLSAKDWPRREELQRATKGKFALHSQSVQMVCHAYLAAVDTARQLRPINSQIRYPYKTKQFYPVLWPAQAISVENGRIVLPMGRGRQSLVFQLALPENIGGCKLVWNQGFELHLCRETPDAQQSPGLHHAAVDLGEIHIAAVTTSAGDGLIVSGRGIRAIKRARNQALGRIAKKRSRCQKYSNRWHQLQRARAKISSRADRRIKDLRHKATRRVVDFCLRHKVGTVYIGTPHGVRSKDCGRYHNQRMSGWEYGKDIDYLSYKLKNAHIMSFTGTERGTSSRCPVCGQRYKPKGRQWKCNKCGFIGHRDLVGSVNMHDIAFEQKIVFPQRITYLRPGPLGRSSRADTPQSCLMKLSAQPLVIDKVSQETGHTARVL